VGAESAAFASARPQVVILQPAVGARARVYTFAALSFSVCNKSFAHPAISSEDTIMMNDARPAPQIRQKISARA
jgi:hypothetical protein